MAAWGAKGAVEGCRRLLPSLSRGSVTPRLVGFSATRWHSNKPEESPGSHDDFKPRFHAPQDVLSVHEQIEKDIKENPVVVYMKGVPEAPQCGFSNMVVRIFDHYGVGVGVNYKAKNVLEDPELRQGIKTYSQWPTIPQVYINGEFVGGCDIIMNMQKTGELQNKLEKIQGQAEGSSQ